MASDLTWRRSTQDLLPARRPNQPDDGYRLYPTHDLGPGAIGTGWGALAERIAEQRQVTIDGFVGIFWDDMRAQLGDALEELGVEVHWVNVADGLLAADAIEQMVAPFLGGDDPIFGTLFRGELAAFFAPERLERLQPDPSKPLSIIYGCGAALAGWSGALAYVDLPKNELLFRARAGTVTNLGAAEATAPKQMYKRFYFVDWPALNRHKAALLPRLDWMVDGQRPAEPTFVAGDGLRSGLAEMAGSVFRVRPWFEPGPWGGQWIKERIPTLPQDVPNYAWSFELIVPENGLLFESDGWLLEISFDLLMAHDHEKVLGESADRFGMNFPIRFDFLDTVDGGNLSLQCHPQLGFMREHFGEPFTQDETYYILDAEADATVYIGFREGVDADALRQTLEQSASENTPVDVERFVHVEAARKHDLFLIPAGTIHCSGAGSLVLEISATPYIFTFKLYDWLRLDLEGKPRPLNIDRAYENLDFQRQGEAIQRELIAHPQTLAQGDGWRTVHLPTHPQHFYDVHRLEFVQEIAVETQGSVHVLSLVEGCSIRVVLEDGATWRFHYAETFVVAAAAGSYRLVNEGAEPVRVIMAFIKPGAGP